MQSYEIQFKTHRTFDTWGITCAHPHCCVRSSMVIQSNNFTIQLVVPFINSVASHRITGLVGLVRSGSHNISFITWSAIRWANPDAVTSIVATPAWLRLLCSAQRTRVPSLLWNLQVGFAKFSVVLVDCSRLKKKAEKNYHAEWSVLHMVQSKIQSHVCLKASWCKHCLQALSASPCTSDTAWTSSFIHVSPYVPINRGALNTQHSRLIYYMARLHFVLICGRLRAHYSCTKSLMVSSRKSWGYHCLWHGVRRHVVQIHCKFGLDTRASKATRNILNKCLND